MGIGAGEWNALCKAFAKRGASALPSGVYTGGRVETAAELGAAAGSGSGAAATAGAGVVAWTGVAVVRVLSCGSDTGAGTTAFTIGGTKSAFNEAARYVGSALCCNM